MAILESVKELASKLGAETNGRDITDQLNKINKHLDETALSGRDIAEAVKTYSKNASGGGGGGETFEVEMEFNGSTTTFTSTKNYQQIKNAYDNGDVVGGTFTAVLDDNTRLVCENCYWKEHYIEGIQASAITIFCYPKVGPTNSMASLVAIFAENGNAYINLGEAYETPVTPAT